VPGEVFDPDGAVGETALVVGRERKKVPGDSVDAAAVVGKRVAKEDDLGVSGGRGRRGRTRWYLIVREGVFVCGGESERS